MTTAETDSEDRDIFRFDLTLSSVLKLGAGTHYLAVGYEDPESEWYWATGGNGDSISFYVDEAAWSEDAVDLSLEVTGERLQTTPEPGTLALLGLAGLAGLLARRRRR